MLNLHIRVWHFAVATLILVAIGFAIGKSTNDRNKASPCSENREFWIEGCAKDPMKEKSFNCGINELTYPERYEKCAETWDDTHN